MRLVKIKGSRMNVPEPEYFQAGADLICGDIAFFKDGKLYKSAKRLHPKDAFVMEDAKAGETVAAALITPDQVWEVESYHGLAEGLELKDGAGVDITGVKISAPGSQAMILHTNGATPGKGFVQIKFNCRADKTEYIYDT